MGTHAVSDEKQLRYNMSNSTGTYPSLARAAFGAAARFTLCQMKLFNDFVFLR